MSKQGHLKALTDLASDVVSRAKDYISKETVATTATDYVVPSVKITKYDEGVPITEPPAGARPTHSGL